eukprot:6510368-Pyramimonas_sp.AAC.1
MHPRATLLAMQSPALPPPPSRGGGRAPAAHSNRSSEMAAARGRVILWRLAPGQSDGLGLSNVGRRWSRVSGSALT